MTSTRKRKSRDRDFHWLEAPKIMFELLSQSIIVNCIWYWFWRRNQTALLSLNLPVDRSRIYNLTQETSTIIQHFDFKSNLRNPRGHMHFPPERRSLSKEQKLRRTARYLGGRNRRFLPASPAMKRGVCLEAAHCWDIDYLSQCPLMGEYPITLHSRKSPKSPAWIFDERRAGRPITKRRLSPIPLTGQPSLILSLGNQKQTFHGWKYPSR